MKIIKQIGILFSICWLSIVIEHFLPFAFPASVIGMLLLLLCLLTGLLKIEHIRENRIFSCPTWPFSLSRPAFRLLTTWIFSGSLVALVLICTLTTILTFAATACSIRLTLYLMQKGRRQTHA